MSSTPKTPSAQSVTATCPDGHSWLAATRIANGRRPRHIVAPEHCPTCGMCWGECWSAVKGGATRA